MNKFLLALLLLAPAVQAGPMVDNANVGFIVYRNHTLIENKIAVCPEALSVYARGAIFMRCGANNRSWQHLPDVVPKGSRFFGYSVEGENVVVYFK